MRSRHINKLPEVWDVSRRTKEREVINGEICYSGVFYVDFITHNPHVKKIIKTRLEELISKGYSILKICDHIGFDSAHIYTWLNMHSVRTNRARPAHVAIKALLKICGYNIKVVLDDVGIDFDYVEQFKKSHKDYREWEERNADYLP